MCVIHEGGNTKIKVIQINLFHPVPSLELSWEASNSSQRSGEGVLIDPKRRQGVLKIGEKWMEIEIFSLFLALK